MVGDTISHYRILEKLGQGGMGEVYLAEDTRLGRKVALKFLAPELARHREALIRFRNEARAAAELSHPNIATIHDVGEDDGKSFLVLEYVQGRTLSERIQQGPLPVDDVLRIGKAVAAGLAKAHSHGVVHRDVKSANVMLSDDGEVKILDFGLARRTDATQLTTPGTTLGTVAYMSPEQARGEPADERSDVWSLGVVLYECLTGTLPFRGQGAAVLEQIQSSEPAPPTALRSGIPLELEGALLRCLERDRELRYQHVDDFLAQLKAVESRFASTETISAGATSSRSSVRSSAPRVVVPLVLAAAVIAMILKPWGNERPSPSQVPGDYTVAVIDFQDAFVSQDRPVGPTMTNLVQGSLIETSPCRVLTLEYLKDVRQRILGSTTGPIQAEQALEVARAAGASSLILADVIPTNGEFVVSWRLMETAEGRALGAGRCRTSELFQAADSTVAGIVPVLAKACGMEDTTPKTRVSEITTSSEAAYRHYILGKHALDNLQIELAQIELTQAVALDSTFALAYFALSQSASMIGDWGSRAKFGRRAWQWRSRMDLRSRLRLEAWKLGIDHQLHASIAVYQEILDRWPDDRDTLDELSVTLGRHWMAEEAVKVASQAAKLYPDDTEFVSRWASALNVLWRSRESFGVLRRHLDRNPDHINNWDDLGITHLYLGNPDSATVCFEKALALDPDFLWSRRGLATAAFARGDLQQAMSILEGVARRTDLGAMKKVIFSSANFFPGLTELAEMAGQRRRADRYFDRSQEFNDDPYNRQSRFGYRSLREGRPASALGVAEELVATENRRVQQAGVRLKASALAALDSLEQAKDAVNQVLHWADSDGHIYTYYARKVRATIALREGRPEEAVDELEAMPETGLPWGMWDMERRELIAESLRRAGRLAEATDVLRQTLRIYGGRAIARYKLARIYEERRLHDQAKAEYAEFLDMWSAADNGLPELEDARRRMEMLRAGK